MVSATEVPNILRVTFTIDIGDQRQSEVVCFCRPDELRLIIYYSHHIWRHRPTPTSEWENESAMRAPFTPQLESEIRIRVPYELWSALIKTVKVLPGEVGTKLSMLRFE